jgi:hypothetical protein
MSKRPPTYRLGPEFYDKLQSFAERFVADGYSVFSGEFAQLDGFIAGAIADTSTRDDHNLRRSAKEKYVLEAVSFWIHDQINREAFNRTKDTLIVLPDCLSLDNPDCQKIDRKWGEECQQCRPDCQAYRIHEIADRYGARVVFSKRKLAEQIEHYADGSPDLGIVGIACLIMLAEGMRKAAEANVPARGVLLNFSGCEHWNDQPCASEFTMQRLTTILEEKYGHRD